MVLETWLFDSHDIWRYFLSFLIQIHVLDLRMTLLPFLIWLHSRTSSIYVHGLFTYVLVTPPPAQFTSPATSLSPCSRPSLHAAAQRTKHQSGTDSSKKRIQARGSQQRQRGRQRSSQVNERRAVQPVSKLYCIGGQKCHPKSLIHVVFRLKTREEIKYPNVMRIKKLTFQWSLLRIHCFECQNCDARCFEC